MATVAERIEPRDIEEEIRSSFLDYAMSVIVGRALPDVRDGLKPVHRRILWGMLQGGVRPDRPFVKSSRVVGDVMGRYHPHGDQAIYDALVRLGQDFASRYPLIDPQGNFGSIEGDPPGAMRYCLTGDAMVRTASGGTIPIAELVPGAAPNSDTEVDLKLLDHRGDPVRATKLFHSGTHPILRVRTREGFELRGTLNHPVLCLLNVIGAPVLGWKLLSEVRQGDRVAMLRQAPGEQGPLQKPDEGLAVVTGAWIAEGWASGRRAGFDNNDPDYFDRVLTAFDTVVGGRRRSYKARNASGTLLHRLSTYDMEAFSSSPLSELVGVRSADKRIPPFIWQRLTAFKARFLQSLFEGDGSSSLLGRGSIQVSYSTRSQGLARDVQLLLLELGVVSKRYLHATGEWKVAITNRRDARVFAERVGFLGRKQGILENQLARLVDRGGHSSTDHVPFVADFIREEGATRWADREWLRKHNLDRVERWERSGEEILQRITNPEVRALVEPLVDGRYFFAEVSSVEEAGVEPVYSVRVDSDDHAFITNGFVSHNTESRLGPLAMELLRDIDAETVDVIPNYDGREQEPVVLPARLPNLLANGSAGIAVGMATNIPPHNLGEVIDAVMAAIDTPKLTPAQLMKHIKGPDFPTGGMIMGKAGIKDAYTTGRGSIKMRGRVAIEEDSKGRQRLVVTEVPYQVNPARVAEKIQELVDARRLQEVPTKRGSVRNESSGRGGMRIVVDLNRGANPQIVLNKLYKSTQLQETFGVIMLALVDGVPRTLNLAEVIQHYVAHQLVVLTRRSKYELRRAEDRDHIVSGLLKALTNIDAVIKIIRAAANPDVARTKLMQRFKLSEIQANHILDMPLRRLTKLERSKLEEEHKELLATIKRLKALLKDPKKIRKLLKDELTEVREKYADERRTQIRADEGEIDVEDLVAKEDVVITVSRAGYVKRMPVSAYRRQGRGGRGVRGGNLKEEDLVAHIFTTTTRHWLLFFTNSGKVFRVKAYEIPEQSRQARGIYAANLPGVSLTSGERIAAALAIQDYDDAKFAVFATKKGMIKKTELQEYDSPRAGLAAIKLRKGDELIRARLSSGRDTVIMVSRSGKAIRFKESAVRAMGRQASGVIGMRVPARDEVITMALAKSGEDLVTITESGLGKRTPIKEYSVKGRGGQGVITHKLTQKTGKLAGAFSSTKDQDVFVISTSGIVIRVPGKEIRQTGRPSQGVRVMKLASRQKVAAVAPVVESEEEAE